jgi:hypothetical protein
MSTALDIRTKVDDQIRAEGNYKERKMKVLRRRKEYKPGRELTKFCKDKGTPLQA